MRYNKNVKNKGAFKLSLKLRLLKIAFYFKMRYNKCIRSKKYEIRNTKTLNFSFLKIALLLKKCYNKCVKYERWYNNGEMGQSQLYGLCSRD